MDSRLNAALKSSTVLNPELEQEEYRAVRPAHPVPPVRLVAPEGRPLVLLLRASMEHLRHVGVCPACLRRWTSTQCLSCGRWSPHSDRYEQ